MIFSYGETLFLTRIFTPICGAFPDPVACGHTCSAVGLWPLSGLRWPWGQMRAGVPSPLPMWDLHTAGQCCRDTPSKGGQTLCCHNLLCGKPGEWRSQVELSHQAGFLGSLTSSELLRLSQALPTPQQPHRLLTSVPYGSLEITSGAIQ